MKRRGVIVFLFVMAPVLVTALPAWPQSHPDFSGVWKLNIAVSDFAGEGKPDSKTEAVVQKGNDLAVTVDEVMTGKPVHGTSRYTLDGKETTNDVFGNALKATVTWDGPVLVIRTSGKFGGTDILLVDRWSLSPDGKVRTVKRHFEGHGLVSDQTLAYDRQ